MAIKGDEDECNLAAYNKNTLWQCCRIDYSEFVAAVLHRNQGLREDRLHHVFDHFDENGEGQISFEKLVFLMGSEEHAREVMQDVDLDHDGHISFGEFKIMMEKEGVVA